MLQKYGWLRAIIYILLFFVFTMLISALLLGLGVGIFSTDVFRSKSVSAIVQEIGMIVGALASIFICRKYIENAPAPMQGIGLEFDTKGLLKGCFLGIVLILIGSLFAYLMGWVRFEEGEFESKIFFGSLILFLLVGIAEEIVTRTYLLHSLMASMNRYLALVVVALLFAAMHIGNPNFTWFGFSELIFAGILLGIWYIHFQNIWFPIGLHWFWNFMQGSVMGFEVSGLDISKTLLKQIDIAEPMLSGGKFGLEGSVAGLGVTVLACFLLDAYIRRNQSYEA